MILTPVYLPFHFAVKDTERRLVQCDLFRDGDYRYHIHSQTRDRRHRRTQREGYRVLQSAQSGGPCLDRS